jgi:DNA-binding NtrC family response regulator
MNPLTQNPTAQDPARQVAAAGKAVLVVDDEQNFLALLRWFLSNRGYAVETASNSEDALKLMDERPFELALVDIRMGPMDGLMLLEELKRRLPAIRVVIMTAYPTVGSIKQSRDKGASAFLTKPVDLQHLMQTIQGLV